MMKSFTITRPTMIRRVCSLLLLLLLLPLCVTSCRRASTTICVIPRSVAPILWGPFKEGAEDASHETNFHVEWKAPAQEDDVETQLAFLKSAVALPNRGIILAPVWTLAARSLVLEAGRKRIPVAVVDDDFGPPAGPFLSYVTSDEAMGVQLAAERLAKELDGQGSVAILGINTRIEGSITREAQLERAITAVAPHIKIVLRQFGDASITHQQQICAEILNGPTPPDAIVALSATATRGATYAKVASPHHPSTIIIGFDQDLTLPIRTGDIDAVVMQDTRTIGRDAMSNVLAQLRGEPAPPRTVVPPVLVTRDNLDSPAVADLLRSLAGIVPDADMDALLRDARSHELQPGVQEIGSFIRLPGRHPDVTVQGTVFSLPPVLGVQDKTASTFIYDYSPTNKLKLGDVVAVHGDIVSERFRTRMENVSVKVLWTEQPLPPRAVFASQLGSEHRGETIVIDGTVVSQTETDGNLNLVLRDRDQTFRSILYGAQSIKSPRFEPGDRIRLHGTAMSLPQLTDGIYPFAVVAQSVELLSAPSWWSPIHIAILMIAAVAVFLSIQWFQHATERRFLRSVLEEREQLAFEMHDTLSQSFTGIAYQLHAAREEKNGSDSVRKHIECAMEMVVISHRDASRTIAALRPQERDAPGLLAALKQLAERLGTGGELVVHTVLSGRSSQLRFEIADAFFRIGQEAISNAIQHGHCRTLSVELQFDRRKAMLRVSDDGSGFSPSLVAKGLGIVAMRRRAEKIRATFSLTSAEEGGTTVMVVCPRPFTSGAMQSLRAKLRANPLFNFMGLNSCPRQTTQV